MWIILALLSALFAGITAILAKCGMKDVDSTLATALRTIVVFIFSWILASISTPLSAIGTLSGRTWLFLVLSGLATGASWLCYFKALQMGRTSVVVPIDKLSILISIAFSRIVFKERLSRPGAAGLLLIVIGTMLLLLPS